MYAFGIIFYENISVRDYAISIMLLIRGSVADNITILLEIEKHRQKDMIELLRRVNDIVNVH